MSAGTVLAVAGVSKRFPGVWALRDVSFDVSSGEVHGLVGENGAGKSTLMAVASGALAPDAGAVEIGGTPAIDDPREVRALGLAIVRQEPALMPDLSVADNLFLGVAAASRPPLADKVAWAQALLETWDPDTSINAADRIDLMDAQQRFVIEIVKALATDPKVLILDEPTEHLLSDDVERLFERIRALTAQGVGVVYISHRIREVRAISDRITVLREGRSQGTYEAKDLSEHQIVELIVGKSVDHEFPAKRYPSLAVEPVLRVKALSGPGFENVSLDVRPGEIVGLAGMDGNGKREFLTALAGILPSDGSVTVAGAPVARGSSARASSAGIQFLSGSRHRDGMFADMTVRENFSYRLLARLSPGGFINRSKEAAEAERAVREFEVKSPTVETPIGSLSGGNQQKVLLAGLLAASPKVVLIDEPTQGVDIGARVFIYQAIADAAETGTAFIVVSSDAGELAGLCHKVNVFSRGTIASDLDAGKVSENAIITEVLTSGATRSRDDRERNGFAHAVRWLAGHWAPVAMVAGIIFFLGLYASISNEFYLTGRNLGGMLTLVAALALVAYGQQLLLLIGGIDLSVGPLMGLTTVVMSFFYFEGASAADQFLGIVLVLISAIAVGLLNWMLVDPIRMHPMMATLATFMGLQAVALILRPTPSGMIDFAFLDTVNARWSFIPVVVLVALVLALALEFMMFRSALGIKLRGFGSRPVAARVSGISERRIKLVAYIGCSVLAAVAGVVMVGQVGIGDAMSGNDYTLASIAAAVIGGASLFGARGSFLGAFLGALLITQVNVVTTFLSLSDAWRSILLGLMIVIAVALYSKARKMVVAV